MRAWFLVSVNLESLLRCERHKSLAHQHCSDRSGVQVGVKCLREHRRIFRRLAPLPGVRRRTSDTPHTRFPSTCEGLESDDEYDTGMTRVENVD